MITFLQRIKFSGLWNEIFWMLCNEQLQKARGVPNVQSYTTLHVIHLLT